MADEIENEIAVNDGEALHERDKHLEHLSKEGRAAWAELVPDMIKAGRVKQTDLAALTRYCDMVGRYWKMSATVNTEGETILTPTIATDAKGNPGMMRRRHPLLSEMRSLMSELRQLEDRFGMSPLARANLVSKQLGAGSGGGAAGLNLGDADNEGGEADGPDPAAFH